MHWFFKMFKWYRKHVGGIWFQIEYRYPHHDMTCREWYLNSNVPPLTEMDRIVDHEFNGRPI